MRRFDCARCAARPACVAICEPVRRLLARDTHFLAGREILVAPQRLAVRAEKPDAPTLADLQREPITAAELDTVPGLGALTPRQRRVLSMVVVEGRSQREIAAALGITQSTVLDHWHAARRKIRDQRPRDRAAGPSAPAKNDRSKSSPL